MTAFPSTSHLSLLRVSLVPTEQLCWELDNTKVTGRTTKSAPLNKVAIKPEVAEAAVQELPDELVTHLRAPDSTIPASKEIKKFARKLPRLQRLEWTGREGKGSWNIVKPAADKKLGLLTVEFEHSALDYTELWTEMTSDPIELPNIGDQEVPVSDVPPPATPSCATFSPGSSDLLAMSPMTMGSTIASEDPETPLARWTSSSIQSFPSLTGAWVKETREEGGWGGLGLENISPSPSTNTIANKNSRRENNNRPERNRTKPVVLAKAKSTPIAAALPEKPSLPRAETSAPTETPRRRGRRGGVGRSRGQGGGATTGGGKAEPPMSSTVPSENKIKAIVPTTNPDGWMTVAPRKVKEKEPVPATAGGETKTRRGRK